MRQHQADDERKLLDVPSYLSQLPHCPACFSDLHYSSEWGIRSCSICGYIEGDTEYVMYPRPLPLREYLWFNAYAYGLLRMRQVTREEFHEMVDEVAIQGGFYRPRNEPW